MQSLLRNLAMLSVLCMLVATQAAWAASGGRSRARDYDSDPGATIRDNIRTQMNDNLGSFSNRDFDQWQNNYRGFFSPFMNQRRFDFNGSWGRTMDRRRSWGPPAGYHPNFNPGFGNSGRYRNHPNYGNNHNRGYNRNDGYAYGSHGSYYSGTSFGITYQSPSMRFSYGTTYAPWTYPQPGYSAPFYTAPSNSTYGYYGPSYGQSYGTDYGYDYGQPPVAYNDNRTYNYYGTPSEPEPATGGNALTPAQQAYQERVAEARAARALVASPESYGARFYDQTRIDTPQGILAVRFDSSSLIVGVGSGNERVLSREADHAFGAIAIYVPGEGVGLIFREGDKIVAAYPTTDGKWWFEPMPYTVDFGSQVNLGMVGGTPWVVFNATNGARYVVSFTGRHWQEVGSGTR